MTFRAFATALLLTAASAAFAQAPSTTQWPSQKEGDFVIKDFRFKSGEPRDRVESAQGTRF